MRGRDGLLASSAIIRAPRLPGRALAPTRATLRASSIAVTALLVWTGTVTCGGPRAL